jgi:hypothetical protein
MWFERVFRTLRGRGVPCARSKPGRASSPNIASVSVAGAAIQAALGQGPFNGPPFLASFGVPAPCITSTASMRYPLP